MQRPAKAKLNCHGTDVGYVFPEDDDTVRVRHSDGQKMAWRWASWKPRTPAADHQALPSVRALSAEST